MKKGDKMYVILYFGTAPEFGIGSGKFGRVLSMVENSTGPEDALGEFATEFPDFYLALDRNKIRLLEVKGQEYSPIKRRFKSIGKKVHWRIRKKLNELKRMKEQEDDFFNDILGEDGESEK